jgi:hypothetical protein
VDEGKGGSAELSLQSCSLSMSWIINGCVQLWVGMAIVSDDTRGGGGGGGKLEPMYLAGSQLTELGNL